MKANEGHRQCRSGCLTTRRPDRDRWAGKPNENQQPKLQPKLQPRHKSKPIPIPTAKTTATPTLTPAPTRLSKTVPPRDQKKVMVARTADPGPPPRTGASMGDRRLIVRRDKSGPLQRKMGEEIALVINRVHFRQQPPAHIRIMNVRRNSTGTITQDMHQNATAEMASLYSYVIIPMASNVNKGVINIRGNQTRKWLKIHAVCLIRYMGNCMDELQNLGEDIQVEHKGGAIPAKM